MKLFLFFVLLFFSISSEDFDCEFYDGGKYSHLYSTTSKKKCAYIHPYFYYFSPPRLECEELCNNLVPPDGFSWTLPTFHSVDEINFYAKLFEDEGHNNFWIGLNFIDIEEDGQYRCRRTLDECGFSWVSGYDSNFMCSGKYEIAFKDGFKSDRDQNCASVLTHSPFVLGNDDCTNSKYCACEVEYDFKEFYCDGILANDSRVCNGRGTCLSNGTCQCDTVDGVSFTGDFCEYFSSFPKKEDCDFFAEVDSHQYCYSTKESASLTFQESREFCQTWMIGGDLLSIYSEEEYAFLKLYEDDLHLSDGSGWIGMERLYPACQDFSDTDLTDPMSMCPHEHILSQIAWTDRSSPSWILEGTNITFSNCIGFKYYMEQFSEIHSTSTTDTIDNIYCKYEWVSCDGKFSYEDGACSNHGKCLKYMGLNDSLIGTGKCFCEEGYYSNNCSEYQCFGIHRDDEAVCSGHGLCVGADECQCDAGYDSDFNCTYPVCYGYYGSSACSEHGECIEPDQCDCDIGWGDFEPNCSIANCYGLPGSEGCSFHGECIGIDTCACDVEWGSPSDWDVNNCSVPYCDSVLATSPWVCNGEGTCEDDHYCTCRTYEYTGEFCEYPLCNNFYGNDTRVCSGNGECVAFSECECDDGYTGNECGFPICFDLSDLSATPPCNGFECIGVDTCSCDQKYFTEDCGNWKCGVGTDYLCWNNESNCCRDFDCISSPSIPKPICSCDQEKYTEFCDHVLCFGISSKSEEVCSSNGKCIDVNTCNCTEVYTYGTQCQERIEQGRYSHDKGTISFTFLVDDESFEEFGKDKLLLNSQSSQKIDKEECSSIFVTEDFDYSRCYFEVVDLGIFTFSQSFVIEGLSFPDQSSNSFVVELKIFSISGVNVTEYVPIALPSNQIIRFEEILILSGTSLLFFCLIFLCVVSLCCGFCLLLLICLWLPVRGRLKRLSALRGKLDILIQEQNIEKDYINVSSLPLVSVKESLFSIEFDDLHIRDIIGRGATSVIYKADYCNQVVAFKAFRCGREAFSNKKKADDIIRELEILSSVRHSHIIRFFGWVNRPPILGIVMEYCSNGDIKNFLLNYNKKEQKNHPSSSASKKAKKKQEKKKKRKKKRKKKKYEDMNSSEDEDEDDEDDDMKEMNLNPLKECFFPMKEKLRWILEICQTMKFLHSRNPPILHRDLKVENVLIDESQETKLMDFGLSSKFLEQVTKEQTTGIGTSVYMSPEITKGESYCEKADVFSFGILCYILITELWDPYEGVQGNFGGGGSIEFKVANNPFFRPRLDILRKKKEKKESSSTTTTTKEKKSSSKSSKSLRMKKKEEEENCPEWLLFLMQNLWSANQEKRFSFERIESYLLRYLGTESDDESHKNDPCVIYLKLLDESVLEAEDFVLEERTLDKMRDLVKEKWGEFDIDKTEIYLEIDQSSEDIPLMEEFDQDAKRMKIETNELPDFPPDSIFSVVLVRENSEQEQEQEEKEEEGEEGEGEERKDKEEEEEEEKRRQKIKELVIMNEMLKERLQEMQENIQQKTNENEILKKKRASLFGGTSNSLSLLEHELRMKSKLEKEMKKNEKRNQNEEINQNFLTVSSSLTDVSTLGSELEKHHLKKKKKRSFRLEEPLLFNEYDQAKEEKTKREKRKSKRRSMTKKLF